MDKACAKKGLLVRCTVDNRVRKGTFGQIIDDCPHLKEIIVVQVGTDQIATYAEYWETVTGEFENTETVLMGLEYPLTEKECYRKTIDVVPLIPYALTDVMIVSAGKTQDQVFEWITENLNCTTEEHQDKELQGWKDVVYGEGVEEYFELTNNPESTKRGGLVFDDDNRLLLLLEPSFDVTRPENMTTLAHECLHVCQNVLPRYLNRDREQEAEAYFHSYLMKEVIEIINA